MALIHFEAFNKYASGSTGWTDFTNDNADYTIGGTGPTIATSSGRSGSERVVDWGTVNGRDVTVPFSSISSDTTIIMSMRFRFNATNNAANFSELFGCFTTNTGALSNFAVRITKTGLIQIVNSSGITVDTVVAPIAMYQWHVIEVKCDMNNTGSITVRLDGADVYTGSADFLRSAAGPRGFARFNDGNTYIDVEWIMVQDTTGSYMNDFVNDLDVVHMIADADGSTAAWTASAGPANYQDVDDALGAYDDDTTYISSSTVNQDNYVSAGTVGSLSGEDVLFTLHTALARNDGSNNIAVLVDSGGTVSAGADKTLTTSYAWARKVDLVDPNTSSPWASAAAIDAAEWGVRCR